MNLEDCLNSLAVKTNQQINDLTAHIMEAESKGIPIQVYLDHRSTFLHYDTLEDAMEDHPELFL